MPTNSPSATLSETSFTIGLLWMVTDTFCTSRRILLTIPKAVVAGDHDVDKERRAYNSGQNANRNFGIA